MKVELTEEVVKKVQTIWVFTSGNELYIYDASGGRYHSCYKDGPFDDYEYINTYTVDGIGSFDSCVPFSDNFSIKSTPTLEAIADRLDIMELT